MAARSRLNDLVGFLQGWSAMLPQETEILMPLDLSNASCVKLRAPYSLAEGLTGSTSSSHTPQDDSLTQHAAENLSRMSESLRDVAEVVEVASRQLNRHLNNLRQPMLLPVEILGYIFELACKPGDWPAYRRPSFDLLFECRETRLAIASSCSHFREVLLETPTAWSHIPILIEESRDPNPLISLELARSSMCPLHCYIFVEAAASTSSAIFFQEILRCGQGRLQTLLIESQGSSVMPLNLLLSEQIFPTLKFLDINISGLQPDSMGELDLRAAQRLETLSIRYLNWGSGASNGFRSFPPLSLIFDPTSNSSHVRELIVDGNVNVEDVLNLVGSCRDSIQTFRWVLPRRVPSARELPPFLSTIQLPQLRAVQLETPDPLSFLSPSRYHMPNLRNLVLRDGMTHANSNVEVPILPSLYSCSLDPAHWRHKDTLDRFFRANPTIRHIKTAAHMHDVARFFTSAESHPGSELLPNLRRLHFVTAAGYRDILVPWFVMIRSREHPFIVCYEGSLDSFEPLLPIEFNDVVMVDSHDSPNHPAIIS
ncbi:hypothetical protein DL93DRAFT_2230301 [Clavulina sp. PMI_390]|nr:hypothetical protein DL93DRAFT_2230301 [Clavulina sp. PMI_390]